MHQEWNQWIIRGEIRYYPLKRGINIGIEIRSAKTGIEKRKWKN